MARLKSCNWIWLFFLTQTVVSLPIFAQEMYNWDKELVQKVEIRDKKLIDKLVIELIIPESNVEYLEIFDVDKNGATEGDLLRVHPSKNVYPLYQLSKECRDILTGIPVPSNTEEMGLTINISNPETAEERILFIIASTIKELYSQDKPLKLYFEQNVDGTFRFEFFGYKSEELKQDKEVSLGKAQSQPIHDLLKALYKEFNEDFVEWQPTVIHVIKIERDTLIVPERQSKK